MSKSPYFIYPGNYFHIVNNILITMCAVSGCEIYQDDHLVSHLMSSHWVVHLKLIIITYENCN